MSVSPITGAIKDEDPADLQEKTQQQIKRIKNNLLKIFMTFILS
jgi:hypothetical protein